MEPLTEASATAVSGVGCVTRVLSGDGKWVGEGNEFATTSGSWLGTVSCPVMVAFVIAVGSRTGGVIIGLSSATGTAVALSEGNSVVVGIAITAGEIVAVGGIVDVGRGVFVIVAVGWLCLVSLMGVSAGAKTREVGDGVGVTSSASELVQTFSKERFGGG